MAPFPIPTPVIASLLLKWQTIHKADFEEQILLLSDQL
jgi:hypothetical protein